MKHAYKGFYAAGKIIPNDTKLFGLFYAAIYYLALHISTQKAWNIKIVRDALLCFIKFYLALLSFL